MKAVSILFAILNFSLIASAGTVQIGMGQTAQLNSGDVAVVNSNGQSAVVMCNGGGAPSQPTFRNFEGRAIGNVIISTRPGEENNARDWCMNIDPNFTADLKYIVQRALNNAMNDCQLAGYSTCKQIGQPERRFFQHASGSSEPNQCEFRVFVRGS